MTDQKKPRPYNSLRRREQAEATRQKIIEAAHRLFVAHGFITTTLPAIAHQAGVAMPTITAIFGTKYDLLNSLIKTTVRCYNAPTSLTARSSLQTTLHEPTP